MKSRKILIISLVAAPALLIGALAFAILIGISNPANRATIGEITPPMGFERVEVAPGSFGEYIREFPLQKRGARMRYYDGSVALGQLFGYAVLDLPLISGNEQCCDAVQRMRSEYLFSRGRYSDIHFKSFEKGVMTYGGGADKSKLYKYLRKVYGASNTGTLRAELRKKPLSEIFPGDVLVYGADGHHNVGHAVLVVDVAVNKRTGEKAIMVAQSSMPALTMHIVRNFHNPISSPWIIIKDFDSDIYFSFIRFRPGDLRAW